MSSPKTPTRRPAQVGSDLTASRDQRLFLEVINELCPEFREELGEMAPRFPELPDSERDHAIRRGITHPSFGSIRGDFLDWLQRYQIDNPEAKWLRVAALRTLWVQKTFPHLRTHFDLRASENTADFTFKWDPFVETVQVFLKRVEDEALAIANSLPQCPKPLTRHHVEWLVLRHFRGLSQREIWEWEKNRGNNIGTEDDHSLIHKGWENAAKRLGIVLRP